MPVFK